MWCSPVDPAFAGHLSLVWAAPFAAAGAERAEVFHLRHLTPQHDVVARCWPNAAVVAHHRHRNKVIEAVAEPAAVARTLGLTLAAMPEAVEASALHLNLLDEQQFDLLGTTRWGAWRGEFGSSVYAVRGCRRRSPRGRLATRRASAISVLGVEADRVTDIPNGVETDRFRPFHLAADERRAVFRRWLVEDPQGADESGVPGSLAYREIDLDRLVGTDGATTVFVYVGRFTATKRVPLLIEAFARARSGPVDPSRCWCGVATRESARVSTPLPWRRRVGLDGVFFAGWRGHQDLPEGRAACDALLMAWVNDSYPQTPLEAMAVGLPVIVPPKRVPLDVNLDPTRPTGWLVAPDDVAALADALAAAVERPDERLRRGAAALTYARTHLSWAGRVSGFEDAYALAEDHDRTTRPSRLHT